MAKRAMGIRRRERMPLWRGAGMVIAVLFVFWVAGLLVFVSYIPQPGPVTDRRTDAIVVLTGGSGRVSEGLALLERGKADKLFVSGVYHGVDVAVLLKVARQMPRDMEWRIALGYSADNTEGNARETAEWMRLQRFRSLRLVTASYHMPRSLLEFRRAMPDVEIVIHPVFPQQVKVRRWWLWPGTARLFVTEYNKFLLALAIGVAGMAPSPVPALKEAS